MPFTERQSPPPHAVPIWTDGVSLFLAFPGDEQAQHHIISIPLERCEPVCNDFGSPLPSQRGLAILLSVLRERAKGPSAPIGTRASPTRQSVADCCASDATYQSWLGAMKVTKEEKAEANEFLRELGI